MNEEEALNSLMGDILGEESPMEAQEPQAEEVAEPIQEPMPQEIQEPIQEPQAQMPQSLQQNELVPSKTDELLAQLVQQNQELKQALTPKETPQQMSEEELALQELADKLGLTDKLARVEQLEAKLLEQEQFRQQQMEMQQQAMQQQQLHREALNVLNDIQTKYGINETQLANKVDELISTGIVPQDMRENPTVWRMASMQIASTSKPQETPDAITSTQSSVPTKSATQLRREGKQVDDMAIIEEILR